MRRPHHFSEGHVLARIEVEHQAVRVLGVGFAGAPGVQLDRGDLGAGEQAGDVVDDEIGRAAHMAGAEVTELIQGYVVAMNLETTEEELMHTIFPHPTLSETMKESVLDAYGRVLNM